MGLLRTFIQTRVQTRFTLTLVMVFCVFVLSACLAGGGTASKSSSTGSGRRTSGVEGGEDAGSSVPTVSLGAPSVELVGIGVSTVYTATFTGAASITLAATDVGLATVSGNPNCSVAVSGTGLNTRTITLSACTGDGTLELQLPAGIALGWEGEPNVAYGPSLAFVVDTTRPTVSIGAPSLATVDSTGTVDYVITYSGATAVTLAAGDVTQTATGTASCTVSVLGAGLTTRTVQLTNCTGDGTVAISLAAATASDAAGNTALAAGPSASFTVSNNTAPSFSATPSDRIFPTSSANPPLIQGSTASVQTFDWTVTDAQGDPIVFTCTYSTIGLDGSDPNYASGANCNTLPSLRQSAGTVWYRSTASFSSVGNTATLTWNPHSGQRGTYQFTINASDGTLSTNSVFTASVREAFSTTNLSKAYDAQFSEGTTGFATTAIIPRLDGTANDTRNAWLDQRGLTDGSLSSTFGTAAPWAGTGLSTSPYRLLFNASDRMVVTNAMNGLTQFGASLWINPNSPAVGSSLLANGNGTGNGFAIRQSSVDTQKYTLVIGTAPSTSYAATVAADTPRAHWRFNEAAGTTATDAMGNHNGTYTNSPTLSATGALEYESGTNTAFTLNGTTQYVAVGDDANLDRTGTAAYTIEAWIRPTTADSTYRRIFSKEETDGGGRQGITCYLYGGGAGYHNLGCERFRDGAGSSVIAYRNIELGTYTHVVHTFDGTNMLLYIDGVLAASGTSALSMKDNAGSFNIGSNSIGASNFAGSIDEFAFYQTALGAAAVLNHYRIGAGCRTKRLAPTADWTWLGAYWNGAQYELYQNGVSQNCSGMAVSGGTFANGSNDLTVGAAPGGGNAWSGSISDVKLYSTGASMATTLPTHFAASAERYRSTPVGDIVTANLVRHFDAANAKRGVTSYSDGCASTDMVWSDLSSSGVPAYISIINNCVATSTGWQSTPKRLVTNDSNTQVILGTVNLGNTFTLEFWTRMTSLANARMLFSNSGPNNAGAGVNRDGIRLYVNTEGSTDAKLILETGNGAASAQTATASSTFAFSTWQHVVATVNRTTGTGALYINGTNVSSTTSVRTDFGNNAATVLHNSGWGGQYYPGQTGVFRLYSGVLTQAEIRQNCHAQAARFGVTCAGP